MGTYLRYWVQMVRCAFSGTGLYYAWMAALTLVVIAGGYALSLQLDEGLVVTNMSDQVSWGAYIANFTYLVGIAAAAVHLRQVAPFPARAVSEILDRYRTTLTVENNRTGQLAHLIRAETGCEVSGTIARFDGLPFTPEDLASGAKERL